jgi:probable rRNA maturation factor
MPARRLRKLPPKSRPGKRLALQLQVAARGIAVPVPARFRLWARTALKKHAEITVRVVGAAEARRLNRSYRRRDYPTDVLAFSYPAPRGAIRGDIVLCAPLLVREARAQDKTLLAHFAHLTVHALLHLQGYDHARPREARRMEAEEKRLLGKLGYPDPYADIGG